MLRTKMTLALMGAVLLLSGCSDDDDDDNMTVTPEYHYQVTLTNLTHNQPLSPPAWLVHGIGFQAWSVGNSATVALEKMAEGGDNSDLLTLAMDASATLALSSDAAVGPGLAVQQELVLMEGDDMSFTLATMLVNTNDAFAGLGGWDLSQLALGETATLYLPTYDAGTEFNGEQMGTIPGPADGGVGYDGARDDVDYVARHGGVVGADDGYAESVLNQSHRFDGPVAMLAIERTQ